MNPKDQSLDEFLEPLERSLQEARKRFMPEAGKPVAPVVGEAPRSNDRILVSLNEEATELIYVINPKIRPYEVIFSKPTSAEFGHNPENTAKATPNAVKNFVKDILCATTRQIHQENPWSQQVFLYLYKPDSLEEYHGCILPEIIQREIMGQMTDITRKSCIIPTLYERSYLKKKELIEHIGMSPREVEIVKSARGYQSE